MSANEKTPTAPDQPANREEERNRNYDLATSGDPAARGMATPGGRAIDQLKVDITGAPVSDEADPSALPDDVAI